MDGHDSWKNHPIVIATLAVVGAISLCVAFFTQVIMPTQTASLNNQIASLNNQLLEMQKFRAERDAADSRIAALKGELKLVNEKLRYVQLANLFSADSPYPLGLGKVKIGQPIDVLDGVYPKEAIKKDADGYWSVSDQHSLFNHVTYYFDEKSSKRLITHIGFFASFKLKDIELENPSDKSKPIKFIEADVPAGNVIHDKLIEAFGSPKIWARKNYFSWSIGALVIYKNSDLNFVLMSKEFTPGYWPKSK